MVRATQTLRIMTLALLGGVVAGSERGRKGGRERGRESVFSVGLLLVGCYGSMSGTEYDKGLRVPNLVTGDITIL
ncbi:hypothetical protein F4803DRAFT_89167 [Xylaria telfairii]|nr:hypothetical protein F4803DRAFT_89167 [Xylaria telfairii]